MGNQNQSTWKKAEKRKNMKKQNKRGTTRAKNDKQKTYEMKCVNSGIFEEQGKILMFILDELDEGSQRANLRQTQIVY